MATARAPIRPGGVLLEEFLKPPAISRYRCAQTIHDPVRPRTRSPAGSTASERQPRTLDEAVPAPRRPPAPRQAPPGGTGRYAEQVSDLVHHNDPALVIPTLEGELQGLARDLLGAGYAVVDAWGPVQMAVASLLLERDGTRVLFDAERGMTSVMLSRGDRRTWLGAAIAVWARSPASDGRPNAAHLTPWPLISTSTWSTRVFRGEGLAQQARYGPAVCAWYASADPGAIEVVEAETRALVAGPRRPEEEKPAATAARVGARYAKALDRYFASS